MSQKTFDRQTAKFIAKVSENMPDMSGTEMQFMIEHPQLLQQKLYEAFTPKSRQKDSFKVWKTIKIGNVVHGHNLLYAIKKAPFETNLWAEYAMEGSGFVRQPSMVIVPTERLIDLFLITIKDLGFVKPVKGYGIILQKARDLGFDECPSEVAPHLRLKYTDQPDKESLIVAMEPIISEDDNKSLYFCLAGKNGGGYQKDRQSIRAVIKEKWALEQLIVFCRRLSY